MTNTANDSDATLTTALPPPDAASELEILRDKSALARRALKATLGELGPGLRTAVSPNQWARYNPWATLGIAAAGGIAAGLWLPRVLGRIGVRPVAAPPAAVPPPTKGHSFWKSLGTGGSSVALEALKTVAKTWMAAQIASSAAKATAHVADAAADVARSDGNSQPDSGPRTGAGR